MAKKKPTPSAPETTEPESSTPPPESPETAPSEASAAPSTVESPVHPPLPPPAPPAPPVPSPTPPAPPPIAPGMRVGLLVLQILSSRTSTAMAPIEISSIIGASLSEVLGVLNGLVELGMLHRHSSNTFQISPKGLAELSRFRD